MSILTSVLERTVAFLLDESRSAHARHLRKHVAEYDSTTQLQVLRQLLCIRRPDTRLPESVLQDIDRILRRERDHRILTPVSSTPCVAIISRGEDKPPVRIRLWRGDITTLAPDTTAITNAANSQMLGCFQPSHRCIDNVIHTWAGPRLRQDCFELAPTRRTGLPVGDAVTTRAYCLPCEYVIHTVGPQIEAGLKPSDGECQQLRQCYCSVLEEADRLPDSAQGKSVALCGISTGLFAFPAEVAAGIAVETVAAWFAHHPESGIADVVFVTYTESDHEIYTELLTKKRPTWDLHSSEPVNRLPGTCATAEKARNWLANADAVIVSAGAGLSAATGLDYTSRRLFRKHFPAFLPLGLTQLYDVFGFNDWSSARMKWGYYFTHLDMIRNWPKSALYGQLIGWLSTFGDNAHVRTSNADGLFVANGWDEDRMSTPQGQYAFLQCVANCTPESYAASQLFLEKARTLVDPGTQTLADDSVIPRCETCGGEMFLCVRAANWFNSTPYEAGEVRWKNFKKRVLRGAKGNTVILELGVGMNTPGVLKWPNEDLVRQGGGKVRLIRIGLGRDAGVPWDLEDEGLATCVEGDISAALPLILPAVSLRNRIPRDSKTFRNNEAQ